MKKKEHFHSLLAPCPYTKFEKFYLTWIDHNNKAHRLPNGEHVITKIIPCKLQYPGSKAYDPRIIRKLKT